MTKRTETYKALAFLPVMAVVLPSAALAVPGAGQLLNEQQQKQMIPSPQSFPSPDEAVPTVRQGKQKGTSIWVKSFRFSGYQGTASEADLQAVVAPWVGKTLSMHELQAVADQVTSYLKKQGWPLASGYLPKQDVTDGVIEISILQGRVEKGGVVVNAAGVRIAPDRLKRIADNALPSDGTPRQEDFERAVLLINDLPGMSAKATMEKGAEPGTTRLLIDAKEGPLLSGKISADNFGNRFTGPFEVLPTLNINDPLGIGDQIIFSGTKTNGGGVNYGQIGYSLPLGTEGLRFNGTYSYLQYDLDAGKAGVTSDGAAQNATADVAYPFLRTRSSSIMGGIGYNYKHLIDNVSSLKTSDRKIQSGDVTAVVSHMDTLGGGGSTTGIFTVITGNLNRLGLASDFVSDSTTARSHGNFSKLTYSLARLQHLTDDFSLFTAIRGQHASRNLDSSEKFLLGGPIGIRAYPVGEASGDEGWLSNVELRYDVPNSFSFGHIQLISFADMGGITLNKDNWSGGVSTLKNENIYMLSGAGVGVNLQMQDHYYIRTSWAIAANDNPGRSITGKNSDGKSRHQQFWVQTAYQF